MTDDGAGDDRLRAVSEEIARVRSQTEPSKPPPPRPSDLERLAASKVSAVVSPDETVIAEGLAYFGRSDDAAMLVFVLGALISPIAGLLGFASARHWWITLTNQRLLIFRLFEEQATFPDSGMALEQSVDRAALVIDKVKTSRLGSRLSVRISGERYRFRFPSDSAAGRTIVTSLTETW